MLRLLGLALILATLSGCSIDTGGKKVIRRADAGSADASADASNTD